jgi:hypothetical protein
MSHFTALVHWPSDKIKKQPGYEKWFPGLLCVTAAMGATGLVPIAADQPLLSEPLLPCVRLSEHQNPSFRDIIFLHPAAGYVSDFEETSLFQPASSVSSVPKSTRGMCIRGLRFWKRLGRRKKHIKSVAVDMSPAYTKAIRENLPKAALAYDHFHVIKLYNEKLTALRKSQYHASHDADEKAMLKGTKWILLKNPAKLDKSKDEPERLKRALEVNEPLMKAYYLKEELHSLWEQENKLAAMMLLAGWVSMTQASEVGMLKRFAKTLMRHREGIVSYYDHKITSARIEGTNAKIRVMQRKGYGFRDEEYLKLKILALHESKRSYAA